MKHFVYIEDYYALYGGDYTRYSPVPHTGFIGGGKGMRFVITDNLKGMLNYMVDVNGNKVNY